MTEELPLGELLKKAFADPASESDLDDVLGRALDQHNRSHRRRQKALYGAGLCVAGLIAATGLLVIAQPAGVQTATEGQTPPISGSLSSSSVTEPDVKSDDATLDEPSEPPISDNAASSTQSTIQALPSVTQLDDSTTTAHASGSSTTATTNSGIATEVHYELGDSITEVIPAGATLGVNLTLPSADANQDQVLAIDVRCDSTTPLRFTFADPQNYWAPTVAGTNCYYDPVVNADNTASYRFEVSNDSQDQAEINLTTRFWSPTTDVTGHRRTLVPQYEHEPSWTTQRMIAPGTAHVFDIGLAANKINYLELTCDAPLRAIVISETGEIIVDNIFEDCDQEVETFTVAVQGQHQIQLLPTAPTAAASYNLGAIDR